MNDVDATEHELLLALFDEHAPVVRALLLRIVGGEEEVEDLLIKTFAEAWENFPSLDVDPLSALIEIARERGLAWARANGGKIPFDESRLMKTLLPESLLARLPLMQRQAVEHVFLTGGSISSFAQQMDVPRDWVFTVLTRALSAFWGEQRD